MQNHIFWILQSTIFCIVAMLPSKTSSQEGFWIIQDVEKKKLDEVNVQQMVISKSGVIIALAFSAEASTSSNGILTAYGFKIYRTKDSGQNWEDISKNNPGFQVNTATGLHNVNGVLTSFEDNFFFAFNGGYFISKDFGDSWEKKIELEKEKLKWFINDDLRVSNAWRTMSLWKSSGENWENYYNSAINGDTSVYLFVKNDLVLCGLSVLPQVQKLGGKYCQSEYNSTKYIKGKSQINYSFQGLNSGYLREVYSSKLNSNVFYTRFPYDDMQNAKPTNPNPCRKNYDSRAYSGFAVNRLFKSNDGGKTFDIILDRKFEEVLRILPICNDDEIFIIAKPNSLYASCESNFFHSKDGGKSWEQIMAPGDTKYFIHAQDGSIITGTFAGIFKSNKKFGCGSEVSNPMPVFGTTIITHGISLGIKDHLHLDWTERMATEIINKAGYGNVYKYEPETGKLRIIIDASGGRPIGKREDIVIFDWSAESGIKEKGFTAAAAEALYLTLAKLNPGKFGLDKMHFIGHGRGCIVNSLAIEKFYQLGDKGSFSIDQVTNLGPYELDCDIDDEHPDININWPAVSAPNNGIIKWGDFPDQLYTDTYWQQNGKQMTFESYQVVGEMVFDLVAQGLENAISNKYIEEQYKKTLRALKTSLMSQQTALRNATDESEAVKVLKVAGELIAEAPIPVAQIVAAYITSRAYALQFFEIYMASNVDTRQVQGSSNFEWRDYEGKTVVHNQLPFIQESDLIGICDAYIESIKTSSFGECTYGPNPDIGGYCLSRLNGGVEHRTYHKGEMIQPFNHFNNFKFLEKNVDRVRGILNGSFDRTSALEINPQVAGWAYHGGGQDFQGPILSGYIGEMATLTHFEDKPPPVLRHNRFYIPQDANQISFLIKTSNVKNGKLNIKLEDVISGEIKTIAFTIDAEIVSFSERKIDVSGFSHSVVTLTFEFSGEIYDEKQSLAPSLYLDEIKFSTTTNTSSSSGETSTMDNSSKIDLSPTQEDQATDIPTKEIITLNSSNSKVLAVGYNSIQPGGKVVIWDDKNQPDIAWELIEFKKDHVKIKNVNSGLFLAVSGGSKQKGSRLIIWSDAGQDDIIWKVETAQDGKVKIKNVASGLYLALSYGKFDNGTEVVLWSDEDQPDIFWKIKKRN